MVLVNIPKNSAACVSDELNKRNVEGAIPYKSSRYPSHKLSF